MRPVVLICTHQRVEITIKNIESLLRQSVVPEIILVISDPTERKQFRARFPDIYITEFKNMPLGNKFQHGVDVAKYMNADPLIINGSDDILGTGFIERACALVNKGVDFVGLYHWHILHEGTLYYYKYNARMPLGGGRVFSKRALDAMKWRIFDTSRNKHLDDLAYALVTQKVTLDKVYSQHGNDFGLNIISIKGDWKQMNTFDRLAVSKNCTLISSTEDLTQLEKLCADYQP